jgi:hypothetical protein
MADIIELIRADHRRIRRLEAVLRAAARSCGSEPGWVLPRTWDGLAEAIEAHITAEQEICWPAVSSASPQDPAELREAAADNEEIRETIAEAARQPTASPSWWRAVNDTLRTCSCHLDREEHGLLPCLARSTGRALRDQLGRQWLAFVSARSSHKLTPSSLP